MEIEASTAKDALETRMFLSDILKGETLDVDSLPDLIMHFMTPESCKFIH